MRRILALITVTSVGVALGVLVQPTDSPSRVETAGAPPTSCSSETTTSLDAADPSVLSGDPIPDQSGVVDDPDVLPEPSEQEMAAELAALQQSQIRAAQRSLSDSVLASDANITISYPDAERSWEDVRSLFSAQRALTSRLVVLGYDVGTGYHTFEVLLATENGVLNLEAAIQEHRATTKRILAQATDLAARSRNVDSIARTVAELAAVSSDAEAERPNVVGIVAYGSIEVARNLAANGDIVAVSAPGCEWNKPVMPSAAIAVWSKRPLVTADDGESSYAPPMPPKE